MDFTYMEIKYVCKMHKYCKKDITLKRIQAQLTIYYKSDRLEWINYSKIYGTTLQKFYAGGDFHKRRSDNF